MRLLLIVIVSPLKRLKRRSGGHELGEFVRPARNTTVLPALARIGQETVAHASSMSRVSHHAVLLLAFWWRDPCLRRVVWVFFVFCRFWTQEGGTVSQISLALLSV